MEQNAASVSTTAPGESARPGLVRVLARRDVLALAFGAMIGWGWIPLTGEYVGMAGSGGALLAFLAGGLAMVLVGLTYGELASAMPRVGGEHVYSYRAMGATASFVCTWAIAFGYVSVVAFEAVAFPTVLQIMIPQYAVGRLWTVAGWDVNATWVAVGIAGSLVMTAVNYVGVTLAAFVQRVALLALVAVGMMFVAGAFATGDPSNLEPLFVGGLGGLAAVMVMVPFLFVGFDVIPQAAEEIDLPFREIGKVITLAVVAALAFYLLVILGTSLVFSRAEIALQDMAVPAAMGAAFGSPRASDLVIVAGLAGIVTSWNAFYVGGSRAIFALADAGMLPRFLARLHPRYRTPSNAVLFIGALSCLAPLLGRPALVWLVNAGGLGVVTAYLFVAASFLLLRRREPDMPRPFRAPQGALVGWLAVILSVGFILLYVTPGSPASLSWLEASLFAGWMLIGGAMYGWCRRSGRS